MIEFEGPLVYLYNETEHNDPIANLDNLKEQCLNRLNNDRDLFLGWLATINIKYISTLKIETLDLLVSCWIASKNYYSN